MVTVVHNGGYGYSATSDLTKSGIFKATEEAKKWAEYSSGKLIHTPKPPDSSIDNGKYFTHEKDGWGKESNKDKVDYLMKSINHLNLNQPYLIGVQVLDIIN